MAAQRKSKTSPDPPIDGKQQRKRKVSDMLGSQWSKDEIRLFYQAYRKHGTNWKKVSDHVRTRSVEMVEAIYNMNKSYLSLPEGAASVVGLVAMMSDHYNVLDAMEGERENQTRDEDGVSRRIRVAKDQGNKQPVNDLVSVRLNHHPVLGLPRVVGRRTPRFFAKGDAGKHKLVSEVIEASARRALAETSNTGERARAEGVLKRSVDQLEVWSKQKKPRLREIKSNQSDKRNSSSVVENEGMNTQIEKPLKKRSRQLIYEDDTSGLEGLQALVEAVKEMEPARNVGSDSSVQVKEGNIPMGVNDSSSKPEAKFAQPEKDKYKILRLKLKRNHDKDSATKTAEVGKDSGPDGSLIFEAELWSHQDSMVQKGKDKSTACKLQDPRAEVVILSELRKMEDAAYKKKKPMNQPKLPASSVILPKQVKAVGLPESSSASVKNLPIAGNNSVVPKKLNRRMMHSPKAMVLRKTKSVEDSIEDQQYGYSTSLHNRAQDTEVKFSHCLSSQNLRRWCAFEWFYSAIDYPWFAQTALEEYINHVGIAHVPRLTRTEWSIIRGSLGKPRRLSQQFLGEEKEKLYQYRESVRTHYTEPRTRSREVVPSDLALPPTVGQRVIACHPKTKEIHDGSILTVDRNRCRVQFDRPELGVEFVMDIDCMPLDPLENVPCALRRHNITSNEECQIFKESIYGRPVDWKHGEHMNCARSENMHQTDDLPQISLSHYSGNTLSELAKGNTLGAISQAQGTPDDGEAVEGDIQAFVKLNSALQKKEALVSEWKDMNDQLLKSKSDEGNCLINCKIFKDRYCAVILQLKDANEHISSALLNLRLRNNPAPGRNLPATSCSAVNCSVDLHERGSGPNVYEVVETSRVKAQKMVDVATLAMSSLKEGEDVLTKIGEALESAISGNSVEYSGLESVGPLDFSDPDSPDLTYNGQELVMTLDAADSPTNASEQLAAQFPSALISSCVAALLMIQECSGRQYPPAKVAEILDTAFRSLKPWCSQNIPIYREIEMCMGMVKNQILKLIPSTFGDCY